jgi:uroporphyrinogen decarboxylase
VDEMDALERVKAALECRPCDKVPVFPQIGDHAGRLLGYDITEMFDDVSKAVEAHLSALDMYHYDVTTIQVETSWPIIEACGGTVTYPEGKAPWIIKHPIKDVAEIENLTIPDFQASKRVANIFEGTQKLKKNAGVPVAAFVTGPITMGFHLFGYEEAVKIIPKNKDFLPLLTKKAAEIILAFARSIKIAGADIIVICEHDAQMVSPMYIRKFCLPHLETIFQVFDYNILHMCGGVMKHLEVNTEGIKTFSRLKAISVGPEIDMQALRNSLGGSIGVIGNIDHINILPHGTPEEIEAVCKRVLEENKHAPGFMLAPGCEITVDTPKENIKAFVNAAGKYGELS